MEKGILELYDEMIESAKNWEQRRDEVLQKPKRMTNKEIQNYLEQPGLKKEFGKILRENPISIERICELLTEKTGYQWTKKINRSEQLSYRGRGSVDGPLSAMTYFIPYYNNDSNWQMEPSFYLTLNCNNKTCEDKFKLASVDCGYMKRYLNNYLSCYFRIYHATQDCRTEGKPYSVQNMPILDSAFRNLLEIVHEEIDNMRFSHKKQEEATESKEQNKLSQEKENDTKTIKLPNNLLEYEDGQIGFDFDQNDEMGQ